MMRWEDDLRAYFAERPELELAVLLEQFELPNDVSHEAAAQCLKVFEDEYGVPIGRLRPFDPVTLFTEPPETTGPLSWLFNRAAIEDRAGELYHRLHGQRRAAGGADIPTAPATVKDFVLAWVGKV
jgi:hypothetical protein